VTSYQPGSGKVVLAGGSSSVWNVGSTNLTGTTYAGTHSFSPMAYSGSGVATNQHPERNDLPTAGTSLSRKPALEPIPPSSILAQPVAWGENSTVTDYINGADRQRLPLLQQWQQQPHHDLHARRQRSL